MANDVQGRRITIRGIVQGVGFRPFVYGLAAQHKLNGWVLNSSSGVEIEVEGNETALSAFTHALQERLPPLAKIDEFNTSNIAIQNFKHFKIRHSKPKPGEFIPVSPDVSICDDCLKELFDSANRRYRYPFINCTNCGPRFTIIKDIPYDRPKTSMANFPLCPECLQEYENPLDRRFHAQPVACEVCGPYIWYEENGTVIGEKEQGLQAAREAIKSGKVIAIKGLGGFHLACDASNNKAVNTLRLRKRRSDKPFALMAFDLHIIRQFCEVNPKEEELLSSRQRPIVLLDKKGNPSLSDAIAPNQKTLGFMLPYTPLHLLLLEPADDFPDVLVMTSGNLSEEPIAFKDDDAIQRLSPLVDGFLMHNRPIYIRVDDSVVRVFNDAIYPLRRSRGYAPNPIVLKEKHLSIFAAGGELKNTFGFTRDQYAFLSHHIGDLENYETLRSFEEGIDHFEKLFRITPQAIACDSHPSYLASKYARERAQEENLPLVEIQHHHAHLSACLADNGLEESEAPVIGLIFDGTGYGTDGTIWGGEFLVGNCSSFERVHHLQTVPQPGGDLATRTPARMALAHLWQNKIRWRDNLSPVQALSKTEKQVILHQLETSINTPLTSSMGRLFDAVSSLIGIRQTINYEGQAAIEMETVAASDENNFYEIEFKPEQTSINLHTFWEQLLNDIDSGTPPSVLSARFHNSIAQLSLKVSLALQSRYAINTVVISGGVWQNRYLFNKTVALLQQNQFKVLTHKHVPTNDGGIALGQLLIAENQLKKKYKINSKNIG